MHKNITLGLFDTTAQANSAYDKLTERGYTSEDISVITREDFNRGDLNIDNDMKEGVVSGATTGGTLGGILGLLAGVGALTIPGLGALFITGPLVAALGLTGVLASTASGALTGAIAGGLISALKELGVDEATAKNIEDGVKEGKILVGVASHDESDEDDEIEDILEECGADDVVTMELKHS